MGDFKKVFISVLSLVLFSASILCFSLCSNTHTLSQTQATHSCCPNSSTDASADAHMNCSSHSDLVQTQAFNFNATPVVAIVFAPVVFNAFKTLEQAKLTFLAFEPPPQELLVHLKTIRLNC